MKQVNRGDNINACLPETAHFVTSILFQTGKGGWIIERKSSENTEETLRDLRVMTDVFSALLTSTFWP